MTTGTKSEQYHRGLELAEAGQYQEALFRIEEHLHTAPHDVEALNDAGAILHCLGRTTEAINRFVQARRLNPDSAEVVWNLAEAYLADGSAAEAMLLFDDMDRMDILNVDVLNRAANIFLNQANIGHAIEVLLRSLQLAPQQKILSSIIEVIRCKRPRITYFRDPSDLAQSTADINQFISARFPLQHAESHNVEGIYELTRRNDIAWFEGLGDVVAEVSKKPKVGRIVLRLQHLEPYDRWPTQVQWQNIDALIVPDRSSVKETLLAQVPHIKSSTHLVAVPYGVNLDKFKLMDRSSPSPDVCRTDYRRPKNLACVGRLSMTSNPMFLLQCMQKLHYIDPEYKLFFAGPFESLSLEHYVRHMVQSLALADVVSLEPWPQDLNAWLRDKGCIVCSSITDFLGTALLEGMACGLKPVIHNFPGASEIFPSEFLFNISEEFCERVLSESHEPQRYRRFVEENFPMKKSLREIDRILAQLEADIDLQPTDTNLVPGTVNAEVACDMPSRDLTVTPFNGDPGHNAESLWP